MSWSGQVNIANVLSIAVLLFGLTRAYFAITNGIERLAERQDSNMAEVQRHIDDLDVRYKSARSEISDALSILDGRVDSLERSGERSGVIMDQITDALTRLDGHLGELERNVTRMEIVAAGRSSSRTAPGTLTIPEPQGPR